MNYKEASVYWLHLAAHTDPYSEGYIGVSTRPAQRIKDHFIAIRAGVHKNPHLSAAITKHGEDKIISEIILSGEKEFCYETESVMRPVKAVGWNVAAGGYKGPGKKKGTTRESEILAKKNPTANDIEYLKNKKKRLEEKKRRDDQAAEKKLVKHDFIGRPICESCNKNPRSINYVKEGVYHYRTQCDSCRRLIAKLPPRRPKWTRSGYKKKPACDLCGFKCVYQSQIIVYHIDGNLENIELSNLRSICLNCIEVVKRTKVTWRRGDLRVDY
jgi:hypothetical protein